MPDYLAHVSRTFLALFALTGYLWTAWLAAGGDELPIVVYTVLMWLFVSYIAGPEDR